MQKQRIIILGGGISGLTVGYELAKHLDHFEIQLFEKNDRLGGWIDTDTSSGFFFEKGPRVFRGSRSADFLALTNELGLHSELIESSKEGRCRYLWTEGRLKKLPIVSWGLIRGFLKDWNTPCVENDDESVWGFACRRFNATVAQQLFDPLVVGIYGGDIKTVSMKSCFPFYKNLEQKHGSVLKGLLRQSRFKGPYMFGFQRGMKSVVERLQERTSIDFHIGEEVQKIAWKGEKYEVTTSHSVYEADYLFSALPAPVIGKLLIPTLAHLAMEGTTIVNLGYHKKILNKKGFGYLVSSKEKERVLGVVFDSNVFPQYNSSPQETRLTVKLKGAHVAENEARSRALAAVARHLGITALPTCLMVTHAPEVFPQFEVGHQKRMQLLEKQLGETHPRLKLVGNYLYGVGVNDCIARARSVVDSFLRATDS